MTTTCATCLSEYDNAAWQKLPRLGVNSSAGRDDLELRRCRCQETLARNLRTQVFDILDEMKKSMDEHKQRLEQLTRILGE